MKTFEEYYRLHFKPVFYFVQAILSSYEGGVTSAEAYDVTQETFLLLLKELRKDRMKTCKHVRNWLYRVASNRAHNTKTVTSRLLKALDRLKREIPFLACSQEEGSLIEAIGSISEIDNKLSQQRQLLAQVLSPRQMEILMLDVDGFSGMEMAEILGISYDNARQRLHRARERLNRIYLENREDCPHGTRQVQRGHDQWSGAG